MRVTGVLERLRDLQPVDSLHRAHPLQRSGPSVRARSSDADGCRPLLWVGVPSGAVRSS